MRTINIDPITDPRWLAFVQEQPGATLFHLPAWFQSLHATYKFGEASLAFLEGDRLVGIFPLVEVRSRLTGKRAVCLPFSDACGPLLEDVRLLDEIIPYCLDLYRQNRWKYIEIHDHINHPALLPSTRFKRHILELQSDSDAVFANFRATFRNVIRQAMRRGVTVERRQDISAMKEFMRLQFLTRKRLGVPPQSEDFFLNCQKFLISQRHGFVSLAIFEGKVVAASVFLHFKDSVLYKYSASNNTFLHVSPNHMILWDAIQWACETGHKVLDFGRTDLEDTGLQLFKKGWGAVECDLLYCRIAPEGTPSLSSERGLLETMRPILRTLPLPILKMMGKFLYRHAG